MFETTTLTEMDFESVLQRTTELSELFREVGPKHDIENTFAAETIQPFKKSGLGGYQVPREFGGLGGDLLGTSKIVSELSRGDFQERVEAESFFIADFAVDENGQGDGVRIEMTWNALGMHATGTQTIHFEGFYIPPSGFICEWRAGAFGVLEWASLMFASIYYGMQLRILEEATAVLSKKTLGATFGAIVAADTKVASVGHIIDGVGDLASRAELSRRVLYQTCADVTNGYDDNWPLALRFPYIGLAKTFIAENVMHMSKRAMSLVGGSSFKKGAIFDRLYRDPAASMFQPLNGDQSQTYIGEYLLAPEDPAD